MVDTPEEKKYKIERDKLRKEEPRKWDHIQKERDKIRDKKASQEPLAKVKSLTSWTFSGGIP